MFAILSEATVEKKYNWALNDLKERIKIRKRK